MSSNSHSEAEMLPRILGIQDVMGPIPDMKFLVEGLIPEASTTLMVGEPGAKKTWSLLSLCIRVVTGTDWLGRTVEKGTVLFIDQESGLNRLLHRTRSVVLGHEVDAADLDGLRLVTGVPFDIRTESGRKMLKTLIEQVNPILVVIDALADIIPGADENSVKDTLPPLLWLRGISEKTKAAIILIHHTNKSGGYRGSSAMKGNVDNLIMVESAQDSGTITFRSEKLRDSEPVKFSAIATFGDGTFNLEASDIVDDPFGTNAGSVMEIFKKCGDMTVKQAHSQLKGSGLSENDVRYTVKDLVKAGKIERKDSGRKGSTATYGLKSK